MNECDDFDKRQLNVMYNQTLKLEENFDFLSTFISDQWSLIDMLTTVDYEWKKVYHNLVNQLEEIFANHKFRNDMTYSPEEKKEILMIINKQKKMISEVLSLGMDLA